MEAARHTTLGANLLDGGRCSFLVWAPFASKVEVEMCAPRRRRIALAAGERGYHGAVAEDVPPGARYFFSLDGRVQRPDPASRFQPEGVHGPSEVTDPGGFAWEDGAWTGIPLEQQIHYELHVGTFTPEGSFDAVIPHLDGLRELGITAIELMPVAQFPGRRNWGYDGAYPFAVQESYGGPQGLLRLVNAAHRRGLSVILDVVYSHVGPEGSFLRDFGPYFNDRCRTPWGAPLNFDGPDSDEVRRFFVESALRWLSVYHIDALRLDAVHAIVDTSACPFLAELAAAVRERETPPGGPRLLIAESDRNDARLLVSRDRGGVGLDAQWNDDFHHALHALLTGEQDGYYRDFGALAHLAQAYAEGYVYSGRYSRCRRRRHGTSSRAIDAARFVVCSQNHDQIGNRPGGERLSSLVPFESLKLAAGAVLLSPFVPLLFMGEEYGESAPFLYFVSHTDPELIAAVREGRAGEFAAAGLAGALADPQDEATFRRCRLDHGLRSRQPHRLLAEFYRELIRLRGALPALRHLSKETLEVTVLDAQDLLVVRRWLGEDQVAIVLHFGEVQRDIRLPLPELPWRCLLDSASTRWGGPGSTIPPSIPAVARTAVTVAPRAVALLAAGREGAA